MEVNTKTRLALRAIWKVQNNPDFFGPLSTPTADYLRIDKKYYLCTSSLAEAQEYLSEPCNVLAIDTEFTERGIQLIQLASEGKVLLFHVTNLKNDKPA